MVECEDASVNDAAERAFRPLRPPHHNRKPHSIRG